MTKEPSRAGQAWNARADISSLTPLFSTKTYLVESVGSMGRCGVRWVLGSLVGLSNGQPAGACRLTRWAGSMGGIGAV